MDRCFGGYLYHRGLTAGRCDVVTVLQLVSAAAYVENGDFGGTLDVSTLSSSFLAFFAAFFTFLAAFRTAFVFLDIRCDSSHGVHGNVDPWEYESSQEKVTRTSRFGSD
jgi:hypothetical protein